MGLQDIKIELVGIAEILKNNNLDVPRFQRSYAWRENHVLDLLKDISGAIAEGSKEYFLGSIVMSQKDHERPQVVDGQQRLATATIILAAIRDYFFTHDDEKRARSIQEDYLQKEDLATLDMIPRLHLNETDHNFFAKRILALPNDPERGINPTRDSHDRIQRAAELAAEHVAKTASLTKEPTKRLVAWAEYLRNNVKAIWVRVPDDANAFTIFETLNDRGLPLAISDLLKNYLFGLSGDRIEETQHHWVSMVGTLEAIDSEDMVVTFIRQFWSSKYGLTRERELYDKIKERITSRRAATDLASELDTNARLYAAMLNTSHEFWNEYGPTAREHMSILNDLGMIQLRPLLLAVLGSFSVSEARKTLRLMVGWSVRFLIVGGLGSGALESQYCQRALEVRSSKLTTAKELLTPMKDVVPSDSQFQKEFEVATVSKDFLARYYLRVLENQMRGKPEPEMIPNSNEDVVTLEHILPENPSSAWGQIELDTVKTYYRRIGNMALLRRRINSEVGNKGFAAKTDHYRKSEFELTKTLCNYGAWGIEEIEKRQKELAELAVRAWPNKI
jgi:hypothetical protein